MRIAPIAPDNLAANQLSLYSEMKNGVGAKYNDFTTMRDDGALLGPWSAWLSQPEVGSAFWAVTQAMTTFRKLPDNVRQVAIIAVGAHFGAAYEIYAHATVARSKHHMSEQRLSALSAGVRPSDLTDEEATALDVVHGLLRGGVLADPTYKRALALFDQEGTNELIWLVAHYCGVSVTLNGFAIPVPDENYR